MNHEPHETHEKNAERAFVTLMTTVPLTVIPAKAGIQNTEPYNVA